MLGGTDQELLAAWKAGDLKSGDRLVGRHFPAVDRYFRNKVAQSDIADLIQNTFMACIENPEGHQGRAPFRNYLLGIARNLLRNYYRSKGRSRHEDVDAVSVADLGAGPNTLLGAQEEQRLLLVALRHIPLWAQEVLELHFWERLTAAEIAALLELGENAVYARLRRARLRVAEALERLAGSAALLSSTLGDLDGWARSVRPTSPKDRQ
ncbi:RNA polymerase sigma factor [Nannocystis pusilla]|uniref:RNA polymerase sigma factor n=1 Tax=Nannocystis pusilla TaxID=889268 RepID=UPI003DA506DB